MSLPVANAATPANSAPGHVRQGLYYALRAGAAAGIATAIWRFLHFDSGLRMTISAVVVIQPERNATLAKSLNRVIGTVIGASTTTLAASFLPLNPVTAAIEVAMTVLASWRIPNLREPLPLAAITAILVFILDDQRHLLSLGLWRSTEIIAGAGIGTVLAMIPLPGEASRPAPPAA